MKHSTEINNKLVDINVMITDGLVKLTYCYLKYCQIYSFNLNIKTSAAECR